jgi:hypothetical protein
VMPVQFGAHRTVENQHAAGESFVERGIGHFIRSVGSYGLVVSSQGAGGSYFPLDDFRVF